MVKTILWTCDICGKKEEAASIPSGWIGLEALRIEIAGREWSKPIPASHFCGIECLKKWIEEKLRSLTS